MLPDIDTAKAEAVRTIHTLAFEQDRKGRWALWHRFDFADESGSVVASVSLADAVSLTSNPS